MKFLLFNDDNDSGVDDEVVKKLEDTFESAEKVYQNMHKLNPYDYAYIYLRIKHDLEEREVISDVAKMIEKAVYYE